MASWKEKGVVPDSDDEDFLDSQNNADLEDLVDEQLQHEAYESANGLLDEQNVQFDGHWAWARRRNNSSGRRAAIKRPASFHERLR